MAAPKRAALELLGCFSYVQKSLRRSYYVRRSSSARILAEFLIVSVRNRPSLFCAIEILIEIRCRGIYIYIYIYIYSLSEGSDSFLVSLTEFINLIIQGKAPLCARPFFFGATLTGLGKKDGGVRPIAVGCVLRRLTAKCLCNSVF